MRYDPGMGNRSLDVVPCVVAAVLVLLLTAGTPVRAQCVGDCGGKGAVTIADLILGVNIVLGEQPPSACPAFQNASGEVDIAQLIKAIGNALDGCTPPADTPTATLTATAAVANPTATTTATATTAVANPTATAAPPSTTAALPTATAGPPTATAAPPTATAIATATVATATLTPTAPPTPVCDGGSNPCGETCCPAARECCDGVCCAAGQPCVDGACRAACQALGATCADAGECCLTEFGGAECDAVCSLESSCCHLTGESCAGRCDCCGVAECQAGTCCTPVGGECTSINDCCAGVGGTEVLCLRISEQSDDRACTVACRPPDAECTDSIQCCGGDQCIDGRCRPPGCLPTAYSCASATECCQSEATTCEVVGGAGATCCHGAAGSCSQNFDCCGDRLCCGGACCGTGQPCCNGNCCLSGSLCCNGTCCPEGRTCCNGTTCCPAGFHCIGGQCACLAPQSPCNPDNNLCCQSEPTECPTNNPFGRNEKCCRPPGGHCSSYFDCCFAVLDEMWNRDTCGDDGRCGGAGAYCGGDDADCVDGRECFGACFGSGAGFKICKSSAECPEFTICTQYRCAYRSDLPP